jgi:mono/diheme cytochrome c family protein
MRSRAWAVLLAGALVATSGSAQYTDPAPPKPVRAVAARSNDGADLFKVKCGGCHLEGGFGTRVLSRRAEAGKALLEARSDLQVDYVRTVARRGLGSMPMFREAELSDPQLDAIAKHLAKGLK